MKIEEYECVKMKRDAQARIYAETKDMTPEQLVAYYSRIGETIKESNSDVGRERACGLPHFPGANAPGSDEQQQALE